MTENLEQNLENENKFKPKGFFDKIAIRSFEVIMVFCSLTLAVVISYVVYVRYVEKGDLYGYEEWVKLIAFWLYFTGGAYGAYNDTHVSADLVDSFLTGKTRQIMIFIRQIITTLLSFVFVYLGYHFFMFGLLGPLKSSTFVVGWGGILSPYLTFNFSDLWNSNPNLTFSFIDLWNIRGIARTTVWQIPLWTTYIAIFMGFVFMSIYYTRRCIHTGIALFRGEGGKRA